MVKEYAAEGYFNNRHVIDFNYWKIELIDIDYFTNILLLPPLSISGSTLSLQ